MRAMSSSTKPCVICLEAYKRKNGDLMKLSSLSPENETYMNQLRYALSIDFVFDDSSEICLLCLEDLNKVYQFRKKFDVAVEYWKLHDSKLNAKNAHETTDSDVEYMYEERLPEEPPENETQMEIVATFACGRCQLMFNSAAKLVSHLCPKQHCPVKKKLETEVETVKVEPKVYACRLCDAMFDQESKLKDHRLQTHSRKRRFVCSTCGRAFTNSFNFREHEASHNGTLNYACEVCGKLFQRRSSQRRHLRIHQGKKPTTKPFLCTICGKSFPFSNGMQRHLRTHTGERRHVCKNCGKRFMTSTHLKVHLRTHTGEKPYNCPVCRMAFTLPATLRKHLRVHEKEEVQTAAVQTSKETDVAVESLITFS